MASVTLSQVFKRYGTAAAAVTAVRDLNLDIKDKEFMVLVGPSGCGKTTALRMIAGLEEISDGTISIDERVVNNIEPRDRDIAMVFQNYALYPHMSVYENMAFGLRLRKVPKNEIETRVQQAADQLGLTPYLKRKPGALSGGQRQRVALGRAIVREPKVFLMDEPLSNLDAQLRVQTRAELIKLHQRLGITTIYVTHDQVEAMTMGDRMAVMKDGVLQQCDTPMNIYNQPANMFVAGFIGTPSMNFIPAVLQKGEAGGYRVDGGAVCVVLGADRSEILEKQVGRNVILGVRPSDIGRSDPSGGAKSFTASIEVVEHMGHVVTAYLKAGPHELVAQFPSEFDPVVGAPVEVAIDATRIRLFDPETEEAIL